MNKLEDLYTLKTVPLSLVSDECFTPNCPTRVTQPTIGKFLTRIDGKNDYLFRKIEVHPYILNKWTDQARCFWVDSYGKNDYFIHQLNNKYFERPKKCDPLSYPYKCLFPRPYSCEPDWIEARYRSQVKYVEDQYKPMIPKYLKQKKEIKKKKPCEFEPPFWWEYDKKIKIKIDPCDKEPDTKIPIESEIPRWKPEISLTTMLSKPVCQRRDEMAQVGQTFYHEACTYYNTHFPAPKLKFIQKRFVN